MNPIVAALAVFIGIIAVALVVSAFAGKGSEVSERLRRMAPTPSLAKPAPGTRDDSLPTLTRLLSGRGMTESLYTEISSAGLLIRPSEFMGIVAAAVIVSQVIATLFVKSILGDISMALFAIAIPVGVLRSLQQKRRAAFNGQIIDALTMIGSGLRSGFSFLRAMQMVAQEMPAPIREEFQRAVNEVNIGRTMDDALKGIVARMKSYDFDLVVTAVGIQLQVGGNLADILDTIANTIRERGRISGEMKALTAEGRISGVILMVLPIAMAMALTVVNPGYLTILIEEKIGHYMIGGAIISQIIGGIVINKMLVVDI